MNKEEKIRAIAELKMKQLKLIEKTIAIGNLPKPKLASTSLRRAYRMVGMDTQRRMIEYQIHMLKNKPYPKFSSGGTIIKSDDI